MMKDVKTIIDQLASESGRNAKIAILEENKSNELLKEVIRLALDPFTNFYIKKIPEYLPKSSPSSSLEDALGTLLPDLANRVVTGNLAIDALRDTLASLSEAEAEVLKLVVAKDLKCGVQASTANKVWKNLVLVYPCMLASGFEQRLVDKIEFPALVQLKLDGMRFNAIVTQEDDEYKKVEFRSRNGKPLNIPNPDFAEQFRLMAEMMELGDIVFDGELLIHDSDGNPIDRQTGNGILSKSIKDTMSEGEAQAVHATLWDAIPLSHFMQGEYDTPYSIRFSDLKNFIEVMSRRDEFADYVSVVESQLALDYDCAEKIFQEYLESGEEGIILKSRDNKWQDKRAKDQIKFKGELECDLKVVGVEEGTGKYEGMLGAVLCETSDGTIKVSVGSGFNDEQRKTLTEKDLLDKIVAVKYNARIKNKSGDESLFLPIFVEVREDKTNADSAEVVK
jgi:hypothetical protein